MDQTLKGRSGLGRLLRAAGYSFEGIRGAYTGEQAFRLETWAAVVLVPAAFWVGRGWVEVALLAGSVLMLMTVELLNSAIEAAVDRVSLERHPLAKRAKDIASAAVLLAFTTCAAIWVAALWHRWGP